MDFEKQRAIHRQLLLSSPITFASKMFAYINKKPYVIGKHHLLISNALERVIKGETRKLIINIGPRYGKCISPETRILTGRGLIRADEVVGDDTVFSFDKGKLVKAKCIATENARKESVRIKMRSGREFVCSYDHPMLTTFGYLEAAKLKEGDRIQALCCKYEGTHEINEDELDFITLMIFEGCCTKHIHFSNKDACIIKLMESVSERLGFKLIHRGSDKSCDHGFLCKPKVRALLEKYGISNHLAYDKRIPSDWFTLSVRQRLRFLDLMFATDGYSQGNGQCGITLANRGLIDDIQHMLSSVGIISSVGYKPNNCHGAWCISIPRRETIKLLSLISFFHKRNNAKRALEKNPICITDTFPYEIISKERLTYKTLFAPYRCNSSKDITREKFYRLAEHFKCLQKYICEDFYLDKVVSVESVGMMDLIDIEVEGTHNFVGNGLVSHNSELVSRMFIAYGFALNPASKFLHISYSGNLVTDNSLAVKDIISSEYFQNCFDVHFKRSDNTRAKWSTTAGGGEYATSTLGQITGFGAGQVDPTEEELADIDEFTAKFNPDLFAGAVVIDDPLRPDDALSDVVRETVNRRFETTIRNRVNSRKTPIIIIMQRLHEHDLCGYLQEIEPDEWDVLSIPAISTNEKGEEEALWPFKHTLEELYKIKNASDFVFETQYMQNPTPQEGLMYRPFRTYDFLPQRHTAKFRGNYTDSADTGADWLCSIDFDAHDDGYYVTDILFTKKPMEYTEQAMAQMVSKDKTDVAWVESNNGGRTFMRNVERITRSYENRKTQFIGFSQTRNKQIRIFTMSGEVNNMIVFPSNWEKRWPEFAHHVKSFRKEGINAHDDGPDALTGVVEKAGTWNKGATDQQLMNDFL